MIRLVFKLYIYTAIDVPVLLKAHILSTVIKELQ